MNIIKFNKLDSTNKYAKENIDFIRDKTIISADVQTKGYGRFNRKWVDLGSDNIYMSFVLKPSNIFSEVYSNLTQYLSVCLCNLLEEYGLIPQIKWPNDVLVNNKKICGILAETVFCANTLKGIVLGIGINLNASLNYINQIDRPATAMNLELQEKIDKEIFINKLVNSFFLNYDKFLDAGFGLIKDDYISRLLFFKQDVKIAVFNILKSGLLSDIDDSGSLLLTLPDGSIEKINMGEII